MSVLCCCCRYDKLDAEATAAKERFEEISQKWLKTKSMKIPQDLQGLLQAQKATCSAMIDEKDKLINELQQELKSKDNQYVKHLKKQAEDVDLILERMEDQAHTLWKAYQKELSIIEESFVTERRELLDTQQAEWEKAIGERSSKEKEFLEAREKRIEENERQIQHLRVRNAEEFNRVKIKLETDIQILQQQIQQMKATFQLNAEKLEYNFQVLKKRDEENNVTISLQKRRITRLQDTLNNLRGKLSKQEKTCQAELQALMEEYRKNTEQYRELQKKVKHFQLTDHRRFHDIWRMNEDKVRSLAKEVECADKIIHEQQLGLNWDPPPPVETPLDTHGFKTTERDISGATVYASQILLDANVDDVGSDVEIPTGTADTGLVYHSPRVIKAVLQLLCTESSFLIESKMARLLAPLEQEEQTLMKLDSIFDAIGVETEEDIHQLVGHFVQEADYAAQEGAPVLIHPNEIPAAIRTFVELRQGAEKASSVLSKSSLLGRDYSELLSGQFWEQMTRALPENHERVWSALLEVRSIGFSVYRIAGHFRGLFVIRPEHIIVVAYKFLFGLSVSKIKPNKMFPAIWYLLCSLLGKNHNT